MATLKYWLWLTTRRGVGTLTAVRLLEQFGTPESVYFAAGAEYDFVDGLSALGKVSLEDKTLEGAEKVLADCDRLGLRLLTLQDAEYPNRLRNIPDPPLLLYMKGKLPRWTRSWWWVWWGREPQPHTGPSWPGKSPST